MKLPRWVVLILQFGTMLAIVICLALGWWLWLNWPERTVRAFVGLIADARFEQADEMLLFGPPYPGGVVYNDRRDWFSNWNCSKLRAKPRTVTDMLFARQRFAIMGIDGYELSVEKDKVAVEDMIMTKLGISMAGEDLSGVDLTLPRRIRFLRRDP